MASRRGGSPVAVLVLFGVAALLTFGPPGPKAAAEETARTAGTVVAALALGVGDAVGPLLAEKLLPDVPDPATPGEQAGDQSGGTGMTPAGRGGASRSGAAHSRPGTAASLARGEVSDMAKNTGAGRRVGAVRGRSEFKSGKTWFKRDTATGRILNGSPHQHKGVRNEKGSK